MHSIPIEIAQPRSVSPAPVATRARNSVNLSLRVPPLAVTACAAALGWIGARAFPGFTVELGARTWLAGVFGLLGIACSVLGVVSFRRARTTVNPMTPAATTALVVSGIYRVTRNPMYLGFLFLLLGEIAGLGNVVALLIVPVFVLYLNRFQIGPEENALRSLFGAEFEAYAHRVRRWI
jgi:protein-S-isoprenylcysteine O-methyltransferase Ste14